MSRLNCIQKLSSSVPAILPSMLLCDFANLEHEIRELETAGFSALHLDVMDGVFVPNFTYGMTIVNAARKCTDLPIDVHLMMVEPEKYIRQFREAGADAITIHAEATPDACSVLKQIKELDAVAGIAVNPATPVSAIADCLEYADLFLAMSVDAGFGGQSFNKSVLPKFKSVRKIVGDEIMCQIDGGINSETIATAHQHGAQLFVVGSGIFKKEDYSHAHNELSSQLGGINERI